VVQRQEAGDCCTGISYCFQDAARIGATSKMVTNPRLIT
jgi:hypothetical protein